MVSEQSHGVVMDPEHVPLAWCVRFDGQIVSRTAKGADRLTACQRAFQRAFHPRTAPSAWREMVLYLEASKKKIPDRRHIFRQYLLGHQRRF